MLTGQADLVDCLYLVRNGIPFDVAFSLPPADRLAWVVVLGELEGHSWDHEAGSWQPQR